MSEAWTRRVDEILADPEKVKRAALLYFLVLEHVNANAGKKRRDREDLYLEEVEVLL